MNGRDKVVTILLAQTMSPSPPGDLSTWLVGFIAFLFVIEKVSSLWKNWKESNKTEKQSERLVTFQDLDTRISERVTRLDDVVTRLDRMEQYNHKMSHDLRNEMNVIKMDAAVLKALMNKCDTCNAYRSGPVITVEPGETHKQQ